MSVLYKGLPFKCVNETENKYFLQGATGILEVAKTDVIVKEVR